MSDGKQTFEYDVFLSYSRKDEAQRPLAQRLYQDLKNAGKRIWWDKKHMPSRGAAFPVELRNAIWNSERLVAIIGPNALRSRYVWAEWNYAYTFSRAIVPVLSDCAIDRIEEHEAFVLERDPLVRANAPLDWETLRRINYIDFSDEARYREAFEELLDKLDDDLPVAAPILGRVPRFPPPNFIPRRKVLAELERIGLFDRHDPKSLHRERQIFIIHGCGGSGKSVLANAAIHSMQVRWSFPDGAIWVRLQRPFTRSGELVSSDTRRLVAFKRFARAVEQRQQLGKEEHDAIRLILDTSDVEHARDMAEKILADKRCLIVLDDVWDSAEPHAFLSILGSACSLCITTRNAGVVADLSIPETEVLRLGDDTLRFTNPEARQLLADWAGIRVKQLPPEAKEVIEFCGRLPLALALCGATIASSGIRWEDLPKALRKAKKVVLSRVLPAYREDVETGVFSPLQASLDNLKRLDQNNERSGTGESLQLYERYLDLSVVCPEVETPEELVFALWASECDTGEIEELLARKLAAELQNLALLRLLRTERQRETIVMHQLCTAYLANIDKSRQTRLLNVFGRGLYKTWATRDLFALDRRLDEDEWDDVVEYCCDRLLGHLVDGECWEELGKLLGDADYLRSKESKAAQFVLQAQITEILQTDSIPHGEIFATAHSGIAETMELGIRKADWLDIFAYWLNEFGRSDGRWRSPGVEDAALAFDGSCAATSAQLVQRYIGAGDHDAAIRFAELRAWACQRAGDLEGCVMACEAAHEVLAMEGLDERYRLLGRLEFARMRARALRIQAELRGDASRSAAANRAYAELSTEFSRIEPGRWRLNTDDWIGLEDDERIDFGSITAVQADETGDAEAMVVSNAHDALGAMLVVQDLREEGFRVEWMHHRDAGDARDRLHGKALAVFIGGPKAPGVSALTRTFLEADPEVFLEMYSGLYFGPKLLETQIDGVRCVMLGGVSKLHTLLAAHEFVSHPDPS